jgi:hypothetical protein
MLHRNFMLCFTNFFVFFNLEIKYISGVRQCKPLRGPKESTPTPSLPSQSGNSPGELESGSPYLPVVRLGELESGSPNLPVVILGELESGFPKVPVVKLGELESGCPSLPVVRLGEHQVSKGNQIQAHQFHNRYTKLLIVINASQNQSQFTS